jgi:hypothetical protein
VSPDEGFAHDIAGRLRERGHHVFLDVTMLVGTRWVEEIQSQLTSSQFFLVFLSADSIVSDMVRREVELAHKLSLEKRLVILPVRLKFSGELPYDLAAYLNPIQYAFLGEGQSFASIADQLIAAVERFQPLPGCAKSEDNCRLDPAHPLADVSERARAPLPAADPRLETGAMRPNSPFYIRRYADEIADRELRGEGVTVVAKGPRQSGKSSLLARIYAVARNKGRGACYIDFQLLDLADLNSLGVLLRCIAWKLSRAFKTRRPETSEAMLGDKEMLTAFVEDAVLDEPGRSRLLIFDEVDRVFDFAYRDDFFALIRAWHNRRATQNGWEQLNLVLAHSTDPTLWIQDVNQSPFNVGEHLTLEDFQLSELAELANRHGLSLDPANGLTRLMQLIGGHPYLARQALYVLATRKCPVSHLSDGALDETGPFGDHLRQLGWRLHNNERLRTALLQVLRRSSCDDERDFQRLRAAGLVRGHSSRNATIRCELYERYFRSLFERSASSSV